MQALIKLGGSQYLVSEGGKLTVNLLDRPQGEKFSVEEVLMVTDGQETQLGNPLVKGAKVECEVIGHLLGEKVVAFKHRKHKDYTRKKGHRQRLSEIEIKSISVGKK